MAPDSATPLDTDMVDLATPATLHTDTHPMAAMAMDSDTTKSKWAAKILSDIM